jgi:hypothetical protein
VGGRDRRKKISLPLSWNISRTNNITFLLYDIPSAGKHPGLQFNPSSLSYRCIDAFKIVKSLQYRSWEGRAPKPDEPFVQGHPGRSKAVRRLKVQDLWRKKFPYLPNVQGSIILFRFNQNKKILFNAYLALHTLAW